MVNGYSLLVIGYIREPCRRGMLSPGSHIVCRFLGVLPDKDETAALYRSGAAGGKRAIADCGLNSADIGLRVSGFGHWTLNARSPISEVRNPMSAICDPNPQSAIRNPQLSDFHCLFQRFGVNKEA
jgi:hypothetical protein